MARAADIRRMWVRAFTIAIVAALGCGREGVRPAAVDPDAGTDAGSDAGPDGGDAGADADAGVLDLNALTGVWDVQGADERGDYAGAVEITPEAAFLREIAWKTAAVEGGRVLHWAFQGTLRQDGPAVALQAALDPRGF